jgi:hypothetical protein
VSHYSHHGGGTKLQRRHTIMVCESPTDGKLPVQELPPLEEVEEPSPSEEQIPRLQRGSNSPLSGLPDHTLHNGHTMLRAQPSGRAGIAGSGGGASTAGRHQGALYRSEHRRSLTMGLSAIPEVEDVSADGGGGGGGGESAPPPNRRHSLPAAPASHSVGVSVRSKLGQGGVTSRSSSAGGGGVGRSTGGGGGGSGGGVNVQPVRAHSDTDNSHHAHRAPRRGGGGSGGGGGSDVSSNKGPAMNSAVARPPCNQGDGAANDPMTSHQDLALLTASEMMHVSWKTSCQRSAAAHSGLPCQDCRPVPVSTPPCCLQ